MDDEPEMTADARLGERVLPRLARLDVRRPTGRYREKICERDKVNDAR